MTKNLFTRISAPMYQDLVRYCSKETIARGQRVSMRAVVVKAIDEYFVRRDAKHPTTP
jgi:hypothetical protein